MRLRIHAPRGNGEILATPDFHAIPSLLEQNRRILNDREARIGEHRLRDLRAAARAELLLPADAPLLVGGHQPELSHPGVWAKHFALNGLARRCEGIPLHLIVDSDTTKSSTLRLPVFENGDPESVRLESIPFDRLARPASFEDDRVADESLFAALPDTLRALTSNWGYTPLALDAWTKHAHEPLVAERFTSMRRHFEKAWGCENRELKISALAGSQAFLGFAQHIAENLPRFRESYNGAIRDYRRVNRVRSRTHPAPELEPNELPFWGPNRTRLLLEPGEEFATPIRPRALTLTLFARLLLGDFFLHGIGGGKYDEVTDAIIRDFFKLEPPTYQVVSATLQLPLPVFPADDAARDAARRHVRDLQWNPQRHIVPPSSEDRFVLRLVADRETLAASEPPREDRAVRREWYRKLADLNEQLRHHVWKQVPPAKAKRVRLEAQLQANAILRRRDYSWVLFPEEHLRPFLQQFLTV